MYFIKLVLSLFVVVVINVVVFSLNGDDYFQMAEEAIEYDSDDYLNAATMYWNALLLSTGIVFILYYFIIIIIIIIRECSLYCRYCLPKVSEYL